MVLEVSTVELYMHAFGGDWIDFFALFAASVAPLYLTHPPHMFPSIIVPTETTLIKLMTGDLQPTKGQVKRNMHLKISRFTQHFEEKLDLSMTPLDFFKQKVMPKEPIERIRPLLGRYGCNAIHTIEPVLLGRVVMMMRESTSG